MPAKQNRQQRKRILILMLSLGILALLLGFVSRLVSNKTPTGIANHPLTVDPSQDATNSTQKYGGLVSPLLFGTNLRLENSNDQVLQSAQTRQQLQHMHIRIIRMPVRPTLSNETEIQAAQVIKSIGAYALVVLRGALDANVLADDTRLIQDMNSVFGSTVVYYEYGNEEDLLGINVNRYTDSWNAIVPQLKRIARNGQFIGPVNFQYDQAYLTAFLQHARPLPDEISWHEYTCDKSWSNDLCLARIDHWTNHINDARKVMENIVGKSLPIMITEWNYAPNAQQHDGKIDNNGFMSTWTTRALDTLAANHVFASMQFVCTDSVYAFIRDDGTLTAQGEVMKTLYQDMIHSG
ncbi:MAG TPA: hypothetical protein DDW25_01185 [Ktedonobacter sp.]|nr:hypothetical protein [Ktedonobacter sp.]